MDLSDARQRLTGTERHELRDHAFGDTEVSWTKNHELIADGYFGGGNASVSIVVENDWFVFKGDDARALRDEGTLHISRNDSTGPDTYEEGKVMPGLTKEGVYKELTGEDMPPEGAA